MLRSGAELQALSSKMELSSSVNARPPHACVAGWEQVTADYSVWFSNGTLLETSVGSPDGPFQFTIGIGKVRHGDWLHASL